MKTSIFGFLLSACFIGVVEANQAYKPFLIEGWMEDLAIPLAVDVKPQAHTFETTLVAQEMSMMVDGEYVDVLCFNGMVPGPMIRIKQGDRVVVHFKNMLDYPTTLHWHGVAGNFLDDGSQISQPNVPPGETFTYDFVAANAGTHWYHPHHRTAHSLHKGLYGPLVVVSQEENDLVDAGVLPKKEGTLMLSDIITDPARSDNVEMISELDKMNGVEGDTLLVNGKVKPTIRVKAGETFRLRIINSSMTRYWRLSYSNGLILRVGGEDGIINEATVEGGMKAAMRMDMPMVMCDSDAVCHHMSQFSNCMPQGMCGEMMDPDTGMHMIDLGYMAGEIVLAPATRGTYVLKAPEENGVDSLLTWHDFERGKHTMEMEMGSTCSTNDDCTNHHYPMCMLMMQGGTPRCGRMIHSGNANRPSETVLTIATSQHGADDSPATVSPGTTLGTVEDLSSLTPDKTWVGGMDHGGGGGGGHHGGRRRRRRLHMHDDGHGDGMDMMDHGLINLEGMMGPMGTMFSINGVHWHYGMGDTEGIPHPPASQREVTIGNLVEIEIHNDTEMHHPFHLHGFSFQPMYYMKMHHHADPAWMERYNHDVIEFVDTLDIPPHTSAFVRVRFDDIVGDGNALGRWLFHCHIANHAEHGMISEINVMPHHM